MNELELSNIFSRYIAKTLTDMENNPQSEHKRIVKKNMRYLQKDLEFKLLS